MFVEMSIVLLKKFLNMILNLIWLVILIKYPLDYYYYLTNYKPTVLFISCFYKEQLINCICVCVTVWELVYVCISWLILRCQKYENIIRISKTRIIMTKYSGEYLKNIILSLVKWTAFDFVRLQSFWFILIF